jgi:predicted ATPase
VLFCALAGEAPIGAQGLAYEALTLWILGYPDQSLTRMREALTLAQESSHAYTLAGILYYATTLHDLRREWATAQERDEASLALSTEQGFARVVGPMISHRGRALDVGLQLLAEALACVNTTGERYYEAEVYRIKGALLLQQAIPDTRQAEACFQQALPIARRQQAKSWELRAAIGLSRLWQQQGKRDEAR